jgi:hypothetical protein
MHLHTAHRYMSTLHLHTAHSAGLNLHEVTMPPYSSPLSTTTMRLEVLPLLEPKASIACDKPHAQGAGGCVCVCKDVCMCGWSKC